MIQKLACVILSILCIASGGWLLYQHFLTESVTLSDDMDQSIDTTSVSAATESSVHDNNAELVEDAEKLLQECTSAGAEVAAYQNAYEDVGTSVEELLNINDILSEQYFAPGEPIGWYASPYGIVCQWNFIMPYCIEDDGTIFALWECFDENNELLDYVTATYSNGLFSNVVSTMTLHGSNLIDEYFEINNTEEE